MRTPLVICSQRKSRFAILFALLVAAAPLSAAITGKVTDAQTGNPLKSMVVAAYSAAGVLQASSTTDSAGNYSLQVPAGTYRVLAYDNAGVYATMYYGDASSFEATTSVASDATNINFALRRAGTITGTVITSTGSASGLTVAAYNLDGSRRGFTTTNSTGGFSLVLPPGNYKVAAYDEAGNLWPRFFADQDTFATASTVTITAGQTVNATFHLDPAAHIVGTVIDAETNLPLGAMFVGAYDLNGVPISATATDVNGAFNLKAPAGTYRIVAFDPRFIYATAYFGAASFSSATNVSLTPGTTRTNVAVAMRRGGTVSGQIVDSNGVPIAATVAAYGLDGTLRATAAAASTFTLLLAPGDYKLVAYDEHLFYATQFYSKKNTFSTADIVKVTSNKVPPLLLTFTMSRGARISGVVVDSQTNAFVPGVTVGAYDTNGELLASATTSASGTYALVIPAGIYRFVASDSSLRYATSFAGGSTYETSRAYTETSDSIDTVNFTVTRGIRVSGTVKDNTGGPVTGVEVTAFDANGNHAGTTTAKNGVFDIVLLPSQYRFAAIDPQGRYIGASSSTVAVAADQPLPPIALTLNPRTRRRSVGH